MPDFAGRTDAHGRLTLRAGAGDATLLVRHPDYPEAAVRIELPRPDLSVMLSQPARLVVHVTGAESAQGVMVAARPQERVFTLDERPGQALPDARHAHILVANVAAPLERNACTLAGLAPGTWQIGFQESAAAAPSVGSLAEFITRRHQFRVRTTQALATGESREVWIDFDHLRPMPGDAPVTILGVVRIDGTAAAGASVRIEPREFAPRWVGHAPGRIQVTGDDGHFRFEGVSPGDYDVVLVGEDANDRLLIRRVDGQGVVTECDLEVQFAAVDGTALTREGHPLASTTLWIVGVDAAGHRSEQDVLTDELGRFRALVPLGTYALKRLDNFDSAVIAASELFEVGARGASVEVVGAEGSLTVRCTPR